ADLVIFLSDYARKIIDNQIPDRNGLSVTIPHGLNDKFRNAGGNDLPRLNLIPEGEYLLYVSIIDIYKAQFEVVQAYHKLCQKRPTKEKLVLVGPTHYSKYEQFLKSEINRLKLEDKVFLIGNIPYSLMPSLYHNAKAHIFASACENCPNIVLESLGSGQPLFLSNKPPMPEIAGDAAVYFDPNNPDELAGLLLRYLNDDKWIVQMGKRAYQKSLEYNWEKTATKTFRAFMELSKQ
ncbi:glycosyltransferase, partial [bacterium]|nr:glycosyltransferase [bacterium]